MAYTKTEPPSSTYLIFNTLVDTVPQIKNLPLDNNNLDVFKFSYNFIKDCSNLLESIQISKVEAIEISNNIPAINEVEAILKNKLDFWMNNHISVARMNNFILNLFQNCIHQSATIINIFDINQIPNIIVADPLYSFKFQNVSILSNTIKCLITCKPYLVYCIPVLLPLTIIIIRQIGYLFYLLINRINSCIIFSNIISRNSIANNIGKALNIMLNNANYIRHLLVMAIRFWAFILELLIILTTILKLGLLGINLFKALIINFIKNFFFSFVNKILSIISNVKVNIKNNIELCIPFEAFTYIRNNPTFIFEAAKYIINIKNLYFLSKTLIKHFYDRRRRLLSYVFYKNQYLLFIDYINLCFGNEEFISYNDYLEYAFYKILVSYVHNVIDVDRFYRTDVIRILIYLMTRRGSDLSVVGYGGLNGEEYSLYIEFSTDLVNSIGLRSVIYECRIISMLYFIVSGQDVRGPWEQYGLAILEGELMSRNANYMETYSRERVEFIFLSNIVNRHFRYTPRLGINHYIISLQANGNYTITYVWHPQGRR